MKCWLCNEWSSVMVKSWAYSVDQCQLQALKFSVYLINLLSILLRCNGFAGIQRTVVDQTDCRPPNSDHDCSEASLALGLLLRPTTEPVITSYPV